MKLSCPACGSQFTIDAATGDADARRFAVLVAGLNPQVGKWLIQYLALFTPAKTGLRWARMLTLSQTLEPMIKAAQVTHNGTTYTVPPEAWAAAMEHLASRPAGLSLPLTKHGYLLKMLANGAEKIEAKKEQGTEVQRQKGHHRTASKSSGTQGLRSLGACLKESLQGGGNDEQGKND